MLKNFFKVAFRNMTRNAGFSFINIAGLTLGLTACLLIGLFVWDEYQYDKNVPDCDRIYRVYNEYTNNEGTDDRAPAPPMFSTTLQNDFPEVEQTAKVFMLPDNKTLFEAGNKKFYEVSGYYVDSTFPDVFALPFKWGIAKDGLNNPASIVLSDEMAQKFFGNENPIGKQMLMDKSPMVVTGVFTKDPTFHLQFNYLVPMAAAGIPAERMQSWRWQQFYHYVKLKKGVDVNALEKKFQKEVLEKTKAFNSDDNVTNIAHFQPLSKIHLYSANFKFDPAQRGNITYVRALSLIAVFILLIACFNFINLATAKSLQRAKEVGMRKTIGAERKQLMLQFMGETVLLAFISIIISIGLALLILPWLNDFTGKHISYGLFVNPVTLVLFILLALLVGILAGSYPAVLLSRFQPIETLKGLQRKSKASLRSALVVTQFAISIALIIGMMAVRSQLNYIQHKNLGIQTAQLITITKGASLGNELQTFKDALLKNPAIESVTNSSVIFEAGVPESAYTYEGQTNTSPLHTAFLDVDENFVSTFGIQMKEGRYFNTSMPTDSNAAVINETAARYFAPNEKSIVGHRIIMLSNDSVPRVYRIIGVTKDFNFESLHQLVKPLVLHLGKVNQASTHITIKYSGNNPIAVRSYIEQTWNSMHPFENCNFNFLNDTIANLYSNEEKISMLSTLLSTLGIVVACMGLLGLAIFVTEQRRKEIGIRKVLGASIARVTATLFKSFIIWIIIANIIAWPVAYIVLQQWLQNFAYHVEPGWWMFFGAGIITIIIALITISFQAIKAAIANPVKSLRTE